MTFGFCRATASTMACPNNVLLGNVVGNVLYGTCTLAGAGAWVQRKKARKEGRKEGPCSCRLGIRIESACFRIASGRSIVYGYDDATCCKMVHVFGTVSRNGTDGALQYVLSLGRYQEMARLGHCNMFWPLTANPPGWYQPRSGLEWCNKRSCKG